MHTKSISLTILVSALCLAFVSSESVIPPNKTYDIKEEGNFWGIQFHVEHPNGDSPYTISRGTSLSWTYKLNENNGDTELWQAKWRPFLSTKITSGRFSSPPVYLKYQSLFQQDYEYVFTYKGSSYAWRQDNTDKLGMSLFNVDDRDDEYLIAKVIRDREFWHKDGRFKVTDEMKEEEKDHEGIEGLAVISATMVMQQISNPNWNQAAKTTFVIQNGQNGNNGINTAIMMNQMGKDRWGRRTGSDNNW